MPGSRSSKKMPSRSEYDVKIFATRKIPEAGLEILKDAGELSIAMEIEDAIVPRESVLAGVRSADVLVSLLTESVDQGVLAAGERLRGVANYAVGYNNIDVEAATELGLPVTNTPGVLTDTTADLTWTLLMSVARNVVPAESLHAGGEVQDLGAEPVPGRRYLEGRRRARPKCSASSASGASARPCTGALEASICGCSLMTRPSAI